MLLFTFNKGSSNLRGKTQLTHFMIRIESNKKYLVRKYKRVKIRSTNYSIVFELFVFDWRLTVQNSTLSKPNTQ